MMHTRSYLELERDIAHIRAAVAMLEQRGVYFCATTSVIDPAYWRARLRAALRNHARDGMIEKQAKRIDEQLDRLQAYKLVAQLV